jgi:hypothetical protein
MLRVKMSQSSHNLNESYHVLSAADIQMQSLRLDKLANSLKHMEKDLGIETDDELVSQSHLPPKSPTMSDRFVSQMDESFTRTENEDSHMLIRKSFLTCSNSPLAKEVESCKDAAKLMNTLQKFYSSRIKVCFDNLLRSNIKSKNLSKSNLKKHPPTNNVVVIDHKQKNT